MFNNYKEIVTKAIIGKGKKEFNDKWEITTDNKIDNVLGCWVINHDMKGVKDGEYVKIIGSYDINIWYSYENNSRTDVVNKKNFYEERVRIRVNENSEFNDNVDIIIRSLKSPSCIDVSNSENTIKYTILKELGIEILGDTKIKIPISNNEDDYELIIDEESIGEEIDKSINEDYLKKG